VAGITPSASSGSAGVVERRSVNRQVDVDGVGARAASTAQVRGDREIDFEPTIRRPTVPLASALYDRLGGVQKLHVITPSLEAISS
jgi:hypothetical protein